MTQNKPILPITPKQHRLILALLTNPTQTKACEVANVSRATLRRWLADPQFNQALIEAEGQALIDTTRVLMSGRDSALATLGKLMTGAASENVRRQAANDWLSLMYRSYELQTLEERVAKLEAAQNVE
jgi:hypothetical protein